MPTFATISGCVTFTPGDGAPIPIPPGRVEVALQPDSATLSWDAGGGVAGVAAIPMSQFNDYVRDGKITWEAQEAGEALNKSPAARDQPG